MAEPWAGRGVVLLGDLVGRVERLEVRCRRCERRGLYRLSRLVATHGAATDMVELGHRLAAGCPGPVGDAVTLGVGDEWRACSVMFPQLVELAGRQVQPHRGSSRGRLDGKRD